MDKKLLIVQQYLSWKGHYRQYFENLLSPTNYNISSSRKHEHYPNGIWLKSGFDPEKPLTMAQKIKGRFFDSFNVYRAISRKSFDIIHFLEFEPLCYLLFAKKLNLRSRLILTIHSSDKLHYSGWLNNKISGLHRLLLNTAMKKALDHQAFIVTHYEVHRTALLQSVGTQYASQIKVIEYPTPKPATLLARRKSKGAAKFLIYGQIREDKGIYDFLLHECTRNLNITIAGKIVDRRISELPKHANLVIIDKFLSQQEVDQLIDSHDYMLLPYTLNYTNGAGTFKDSLSKALPVVCSDISIFREVIDKHHVGVIFTKPDEIHEMISKITDADYEQLSSNCLAYARKFNWEYMREEYYQIYRSVQ